MYYKMSFSREDVNTRDDPTMIDGPDRLGTYTRALRRNERPNAEGFDDYKRGGNNDVTQNTFSEYDSNPQFTPRQAFVPNSGTSSQLPCTCAKTHETRGHGIDRYPASVGASATSAGNVCQHSRPPHFSHGHTQFAPQAHPQRPHLQHPHQQQHPHHPHHHQQHPQQTYVQQHPQPVYVQQRPIIGDMNCAGCRMGVQH